MDPRRNQPNINQQKTYVDNNLKRIIPNDMLYNLREHNANLGKMNQDLYTIIQRCEELGLHEFNSKIDMYTSEIERLQNIKRDIKKNMSQLSIFKKWDNVNESNNKNSDLSNKSQSLIEKEKQDNNDDIMVNTANCKSISKSKLHDNESVHRNIQPVKKKAKVELINSSKCTSKSDNQSEKKIIKPRQGIPINKSVLRCNEDIDSYTNLTGVLFEDTSIDKFAEEVYVSKNFVEQEVIPTISHGSGDVDPSNIKIENESSDLLTRSKKKQQVVSNDVSFYFRMRSQVACHYCWLREDINSGAVVENIDDD
uniref:Uncharacterized protein n=1 Tax=Strongyloides stercoralis TaxID=6248 RepID=A0AAF5D3Z0_STRER